jgi:hypothetical protein
MITSMGLYNEVDYDPRHPRHHKNEAAKLLVAYRAGRLAMRSELMKIGQRRELAPDHELQPMNKPPDPLAGGAGVGF